MTQSRYRGEKVWDRLVKAYLVPTPTPETRAAFEEALRDFMAEGVDRVPILREALERGERAVAVHVSGQLPASELQELFGQLVILASWVNGALFAARDLIRRLPREWVLAHIQSAAEPLLAEADEEHYRRLIELYAELDRHLADSLARRAAASTNGDVREVGEEFLGRR